MPVTTSISPFWASRRRRRSWRPARGFTREVLAIASWAVAAAAADDFHPALMPFAKEYISNDKFALAAAIAADLFGRLDHRLLHHGQNLRPDPRQPNSARWIARSVFSLERLAAC
jgi:hypothetical protein